MLTRLIIRNFKRFGEVEIELGSPVVFIGPNNSGKTSAMQALALWDIGLQRWNEKRSGRSTPEKRSGVTVNRRDLVAIPVPDANLLWRDLHVRDVRRVEGRPQTSNIRIDLIVEGVSNDRCWTCGLEFDYANEESFYCRPLRVSDGKAPDRMPIPEEAGHARIAFLPPMSGLAATETRLDGGAVNVRIGEGRTAEVLRNLCLEVHDQDPSPWDRLVVHIRSLFGSELDPPRYVAARGEIVMTYRERGVRLDLSSAGRGLQQTLLLLAYMYANPGAVLLLDEPDAHLEILRQRQIYGLLTEVARESGSQIIAASHSEVLLNQAAGRDMVVAFVGKPHRIDDRGSQVLKSLRDISFDQYYQAEQTGWMLRATLEAHARSAAQAAPGPLFTESEAARRLLAMRSAISEVESALATLGKGSPWDPDLKASDEFLTPLFKSYYDKLGVPNLMAKKSFYELADYVPDSEIDPEIGEKLDAIARVAESVTPGDLAPQGRRLASLGQIAC